MTTVAIIRTASQAEQSNVEHTCQALATLDMKHLADAINWQSARLDEKVAHFLEAVLDPDIDVLWAVRGGEGSADLIPHIAQHEKAIKALPAKILMGCSDFTAILLYFQQHFGWHAVHGTTAASFGKLKQIDHSSINATLAGLQQNIWPTVPLIPLNALASEVVLDSAYCIGGNMSLLNISIGDRWECDPNDKILIIEDWHEKGYVVDRTLKYFERLGWFSQAKAVVFGDFQADTQEAYLTTVLERTAERLAIPVYHTSAMGHGKRNLPIRFSHPYRLSVDGLKPVL